MPWYWNLLIVAAVFVVPIWLGYRLSRRWRMPDYFGKIAFILFTLIGGLAICVFSWDKIQLGIDLKGGVYLVYEIQEAEEETSSSPAGRSAGPASPQIDMDQLVAALRRRVNPGGQLGVKIRPYGTRQIEIKVPRSDQEEVDREQVDRLKRVLASVGSLEFRILATDRNVLYRSYIDRAKALREDQLELRDEQDQGQAGDQKDNWLARWVPVAEGKEDEFRRMPNIATRTRLHKGRERLEVLVVNDPFDVMGEDLSRASPGVDERGRPCVNFVLKATGATKFGRLTGSHRPDAVQKFKYQLGIILDRELVTAPEIRSPIFDRGEITGGFDEEKVKELVDVLNSGSLPAALNPQPISERHTGPELGADTIRRGKWSLIVSMLAVFISVIIYYRFPGLVADIALAMNALLLLASMIIINAEFSLAGIAGFALSIGMAVDANVLIFERMREESARGAALRMTIRNGFQRALSAIIDSNLTTLITAVILYSVGTDQVRGFAVTLFLGIVLSMYTAIFVARVIFDVAERQRWITAVKMMRALPQTRIDFLGHKWVMIGASVVMILLGLVATFVRGRGLLDIDFTGGVSVETVFKQRQDVGQIRAALGGLSGQERLEDVTVTEVYYRGQEPGRSFFINTSIRPGMSAEEYRRLVQETLQRVFGDRLSRNTMSYQLEGVQAAGSPAKPAPGGLQAPASAAPGHAEAAVLSAALLAQAGQSRP
ncbi:MAG: protein translocase subunit SecD, partial [Thermoguttaceae bacterium]